MDHSLREFWLVVLLAITTFGKTIRYKLITTEDGRREIVGDGNSTAPKSELKFLESDLNITTATPQTDLAEDRVDREISSNLFPNEPPPTDDTFKLISKWNTFTENGWNKKKNALYINSTKLIIYNDKDKNQSNVYNYKESKEGRSENITTSVMNDAEVLDIIQRFYDCFGDDDDPKRGGTFECLKTRFLNLVLSYFDHSLRKTGKSTSEKTLLHGKKLLKGALLPLLVLLVIKYLIALPVIAAGLLTIKTFWLSLLSAGVAAFSTPWKKRPTYNRIDQNYEPQWASSVLHSGPEVYHKNIPSVTDKYFM